MGLDIYIYTTYIYMIYYILYMDIIFYMNLWNIEPLAQPICEPSRWTLRSAPRLRWAFESPGSATPKLRRRNRDSYHEIPWNHRDYRDQYLYIMLWFSVSRIVAHPFPTLSPDRKYWWPSGGKAICAMWWRQQWCKPCGCQMHKQKSTTEYNKMQDHQYVQAT